MKKLFLTLILTCLCIPADVHAQDLKVRIDTVDAIVLNKLDFTKNYSKDMSTVMILGTDTLKFIKWARYNTYLMEEQPIIKNMLASDVVQWFFSIEVIQRKVPPEIQLGNSPFSRMACFHDCELSSPCIYRSPDSTVLYVAFRFCGEVVHYENINLKKKSTNDGDNQEKAKLVILKKAWSINLLTPEEEKNLNLTKSGIYTIYYSTDD